MPGLSQPVTPDDHAQGSDDAPVTLVEYGDYQCPSCGQAYPIVKSVQQAMGQSLRFVFRNFPLKTIHPFAEGAAEAAEAADAFREFWPMHDALYENQYSLGEADIEMYAMELGLDLDAFAEALAAPGPAIKVRQDFLGGVRSGVNGTPTFFINGERYDGAWDADSLLAAVRQAAR